MKKAVLILSGGLDSTTLAYLLKNKNYDLICVSFDYGQKHIKELESAKKVSLYLKAKHHIIDLSFMKQYLNSSSLINNNIENPKEEYEKSNMLVTVVPNRNAMMLTLAWTIACDENAEVLAFGAHSGDNYIYADCRPKFLDSLNNSLRLGTEDSRNEKLKLIAPFINLTKTDIIKIGYKLKVPFEKTWSCYDGGKKHCGSCGTCLQRKESFEKAQIKDLTIYEE